MTGYSKLVEALRECARDDADCRNNCPYYNHDVCTDDLKSDAADAIEKLVTLYEKAEIDATNLTGKLAQAEAQLPKRGEWKPFDLTWGRSIYSCTACGESADVPTANGKALYKYCPNCGAKMEVQDG